MIEHDVQIRVRYSETDQMSYVYYGNYASYFEVARVEAFRHIGFSYKEMEDAGIMMPVLEYKTKYIKPAKYDDLLTIRVRIKQKPGVRITFDYEVYNAEQVLLTIAETTLVFVNSNTGKPVLPPPVFMAFFEKYYTHDQQN
ncbi:MAG TPA: thioesterase family protein [Cytophaga sp.]|jgi:acyl-CoA thioester hydrolase|nr:thioesterase family protein [Cytophaga sp.]